MLQPVSCRWAPGVTVWGTRLRCAPEDWDLLAADERVRAARFVFPVHRERFVAARATLRRLLAQATGAAPEALTLALGAHGKPSLCGGGLEFNVSHTEDVALFALGPPGVALGVDVEARRRFDPAERRSLAAVSFAPTERVAVEAAPDPDEAFFRVWSCKEAVIKSLGDGIGYGLSRFRVSATGRAALLGFDDPGERLSAWTLETLALPPSLQTPHGVAAALATRKLDTPGDVT